MDAFGKARINRLDFFFHALNNGRSICAEELNHLPGDNFGRAILGLQSSTNGCAFLYFGNIRNRNRNTITATQQDRF